MKPKERREPPEPNPVAADAPYAEFELASATEIPMEAEAEPAPATESEPGVDASSKAAAEAGTDQAAKAEQPAEETSVAEPGSESFESSTPERSKPLLATDELIEHLKSKGVTFDLCRESEAIKYLQSKTYYFKITAYRTLFQKRVGGERDGQYVGLDFGRLVELASVDRKLRYTLLPMTLDVEHFARAKLMHRVEESPEEDGYGIVADYMASLNHDNRRRRLAEINMLEPDAYCGDLVRKYRDDMPVWVFLELISFGSFIDFYLFCAQRWGDSDMNEEHYMLRSVKAARNACAHSSNMVNGFGSSSEAVPTTPASISHALSGAGFSRRVRTSKMSNPRLQQIATLLFLHSKIVPEGTSRERAKADLKALSSDMANALSDLSGNDAVRSSFDFLMTLFEKWS